MNLEALEKLNELKEKGIISQKEFEAEKEEILNRNPLNNLEKNTDEKNMPLFYYFIRCITEKYACFKGRARRKECWGFAFFQIVFMFAFSSVAAAKLDGKSYNICQVLMSAFFILPSLTVTVRRLHDTNKSGWWLLSAFVFSLILAGLEFMHTVLADMNPEINMGNFSSVRVKLFVFGGCGIVILNLIIFYWLVKRGDAGENKYGSAPVNFDQ